MRWVVLALGVALVCPVGPASAGLVGDSGDPCVVERLHKTPAAEGEALELTSEEAAAIQACLLDDMKTAFAGTGDLAAETFTAFEAFSAFPYETAAHGERWVMNYANPTAAPVYRKYEAAGAMPVGSVVVKSSFEVAPDGRATVGPLALMEKMELGFEPVTGDWKYTLIEADGSIVGATGGEFEGRIGYCNACHRARGADHDYLFFPDPANRVATR